MARHFVMLLLLVVTAVASAQESQPEPAGETKGVPLTVLPEEMIAGEWQPIELVQIGRPDLPLTPLADPAADTCAEAPPIHLPDGGVTVVNDMTEQASDPVLGCMWGNPISPRGFRSVWYRFTPQASGRAIIETLGSNYDTVLAVYSGACDNLTQLACNDDAEGFTSLASVWVTEGVTYYIQVVDWHFGVNGTASLNVAAWLETASEWQKVAIMPSGTARSRHVALPVGQFIYVIGGQTALGTAPERTPRTDRFDTATETWVQLADMPGGCDPSGYSNTTGAYVNGRIYLPSGYVGNNNAYWGTHCVYDIAGNFWLAASPAPWPGGQAFAWSASVAHPASSSYFLIGGLTGAAPIPSPTDASQPRAEMFRYRVTDDQWLAQPLMNDARYAHTAALQRISNQDFVCVVGGIGQNNEGDPILLSGGECYNIASGQWTIVTGPMNIARYNAGSAVGPDGRWYVFGGTDSAGRSVAITEVYNRETNNWTMLDSRFDLANPARAWPRGGFVGHTLWVVGGQIRVPGTGDFVINIVEKLYLPGIHLFLPSVAFQNDTVQPGNIMAEARPLAFHHPEEHAFIAADDFYHFFFFDLSVPTNVQVHLSHIPASNNYDLFLYSSNKTLMGSSTRIGNLDELVALALPPGRHYILVERILPTTLTSPAPYRIELRN